MFKKTKQSARAAFDSLGLMLGGRRMTSDGWHTIVGGTADTPAGASTNSNVITCVNILADDVAKLPVHTYKGGDRGEGMKHPTAQLLYTQSNPFMSAFIFKRTLQYNLSLYGNAYAYIERGANGRPVALYPLSGGRVAPELYVDDEGAQQIRYRVAGPRGSVELGPLDIIHLREATATGLEGAPPWACLVDEIEAQREIKRFLKSFYENGTRLSGFLKVPSMLEPEAKEKIRQEFTRIYSGANNAGAVAVLDLGLDYSEAGMPLEAAQFLQTQKFGIIEVAKVYKIPPHKLAQMDHASYANTEAMGLEYIKTALLPIFTQWEQEFNLKLFTEQERAAGYYIKFNAAAELRGDSGRRAVYYREMLNSGVYSINEVREMEERPPLGELGDKHLISLNYTTLDALEAYQLGKVGGEIPSEKGGEE